MNQEERKLLAWHETMELHEMVAFQSTGLMKLKMSINRVTDHELKELYRKCITDLERNLNELLKFYPQAQGYQAREDDEREDLGFFAADLLALSKTLVRNLAAAITETATPALRQTFTRQLTGAIEGHARVFHYMHKHGYYPAYDLGRMLGHDMENANKALKMRY
ncbi:spore coat protein [Neobacillus mesonae]|uniref:spore coat protein n=1 Tax=Neobacillus mesonae TaxID=1193713 RepID=UPI0020421DD3|nr:spore coat protein [Neobacillus mesonae]MCM3567404.1 spore coat protein [Neobacillus mesonae]